MLCYITKKAIVEMDIIHPCALIYDGKYDKVCPTNGPCWTSDICFGKFSIFYTIESIQYTR